MAVCYPDCVRGALLGILGLQGMGICGCDPDERRILIQWQFEQIWMRFFDDLDLDVAFEPMSFFYLHLSWIQAKVFFDMFVSKQKLFRL